jgi:hypothetical protein
MTASFSEVPVILVRTALDYEQARVSCKVTLQCLTSISWFLEVGKTGQMLRLWRGDSQNTAWFFEGQNDTVFLYTSQCNNLYKFENFRKFFSQILSHYVTPPG